MTTSLSLRARFAVAAVRSVNGLSRRLGRGAGTVAGGRAGLALAPELLAALSRSRTIVLVSATNGKTTTSAMVREGWGVAVTANRTGANMPAGHVAALASSGAVPTVLETDEAWLPTVLAATTPAAVVLLNLSRDQMDRANEVRQLALRWREAVATATGAVIANASDPLVVFAAETASRVVWVRVPGTWRHDALSCPKCTHAVRFQDEGWACVCGFSQPVSAWSITESGELVGPQLHTTLALGLPGAFNAVNATFALVALRELGVDVADAESRIAAMTTVEGRYGLRRWGNVTFRLLLAKNPAGTAVLLRDAAVAKGEVWVAINADIADGRDPSWLYDAPFELLAGHRVRALGTRRLDLATRLFYAGVDGEVVDDLAEVSNVTEPVTVIANYTAFREWLGRSQPC
jgi:UDP-N-acetylmuramyl tripeptide synthase